MKKLLYFALAAFALVGCSETEEQEVMSEKTANHQKVTLTFSPYDMEAMTRAATSISGLVTHLDVWFYQNGAEVEAVHQSSSDADFGTVSVTLDKTKTYTLYAVAHKCADDATLSESIISFPDDKVTHSMFYTTTFSPGTTTNLNCLMTRIVSQLAFETTDAVPTDCKKMRFTIKDVYNRWNVTSGGTNLIDRVSTVNISSTRPDGSVLFILYAITSDAQTTHDITVEALDADDQPVQTAWTFNDVPLRNGYKTTYRGVFFTDTPVTSGFTVESDWHEYDVVTY